MNHIHMNIQRLPKFCFAGVAIAGALMAGRSVMADEPTATDLLPKTVFAYAEVRHLGKAAEVIADHPLRESLEALPGVKAASESANLQAMRDVVAAFEDMMGRPWRESVNLLTDGGIHLALDAQGEGAALLIRSSSRDQLETFRSFVLAMFRSGQGNIGAVREGEYRGFTAYAIGNDLKMALVDQWIVMTNRSEFGKSIIDRYLDGGDDSLSTSEQFTAAMASVSDATATGYLNVQAVRDAGLAPDLYTGKTENVVHEVLIGGIVSVLANAPVATAALDLTAEAATIQLATSHEPQWAEGREYYFGENGDASAPPLLKVPDQVFALSTHRDLSQMWLRAPDLMTDKANEELAQADTTLTTFFSGLDFGEDVLGSLQPGIQLVVTHQSFDQGRPIPAIKLPAFALKFRMRDPELATSEFRRVFQNLVGFLNVVGAMEGQPQLDLGFSQSDNVIVVSSTYVAPRDQTIDASAPINFNFSPTIAFSGDTMVISSTTRLARELTQVPPKSVSADGGPNTVARLDARSLSKLLEENRSQLVAQNMLGKGHAPEQAEAEISAMLELLDLFSSVSIDLEVDDEELALTAEIKVRSE